VGTRAHGEESHGHSSRWGRKVGGCGVQDEGEMRGVGIVLDMSPGGSA